SRVVVRVRVWCADRASLDGGVGRDPHCQPILAAGCQRSAPTAWLVAARYDGGWWAGRGRSVVGRFTVPRGYSGARGVGRRTVVAGEPRRGGGRLRSGCRYRTGTTESGRHRGQHIGRCGGSRLLMGDFLDNIIRFLSNPNNHDRLLRMLWQHTYLALLPVVFGIVLAIGLGWAATRLRGLRTPIVVLGNLLYTVPSLALFVIL